MWQGGLGSDVSHHSCKERGAAEHPRAWDLLSPACTHLPPCDFITRRQAKHLGTDRWGTWQKGAIPHRTPPPGVLLVYIAAGAHTQCCSSELCDVTGAKSWGFVFPFLVQSQGQGGAFFFSPVRSSQNSFLFCSHCKQCQTIKHQIFLPLCNPRLSTQYNLRVHTQLFLTMQRELLFPRQLTKPSILQFPK